MKCSLLGGPPLLPRIGGPSTQQRFQWRKADEPKFRVSVVAQDCGLERPSRADLHGLGVRVYRLSALNKEFGDEIPNCGGGGGGHIGFPDSILRTNLPKP